MRNAKFGRKWTLKKLQGKGGQKEASGGRFWRLLEANLGVQERKIEVQEACEKEDKRPTAPRLPQDTPGYPQDTCQKRTPWTRWNCL